jgi:predicted amidophosphoribosyltransferase
MSKDKLNLGKLVDFIAMRAYGMKPQEAWTKEICIRCKEPALPKCCSDAGKKEYKISAMCESCFNELLKNGQGHKFLLRVQ